MMRTKRLITIFLAFSILLSLLAGFTVSALELDEDVIIEDSSSEEELTPMAARGCVYYRNKSLKPNDFEYHNATVYYTSTGTSSGTIYSVIYTNSFGGTYMRHDLKPHNGINSSFGHGSVSGPHTHYFDWSFINNNWRYVESAVKAYGN